MGPYEGPLGIQNFVQRWTEWFYSGPKKGRWGFRTVKVQCLFFCASRSESAGVSLSLRRRSEERRRARASRSISRVNCSGGGSAGVGRASCLARRSFARPRCCKKRCRSCLATASAISRYWAVPLCPLMGCSGAFFLLVVACLCLKRGWRTKFVCFFRGIGMVDH